MFSTNYDTCEHNIANPYGSAHWASEEDIKNAGLLTPSGLPIGYYGETPLYQGAGAGSPSLLCAGSGAGKLTTQIAAQVCTYKGSMLVLDMKGELAAVSAHQQAALGKHAYFINPFGLHGLPKNAVHPLDILKPDSPTLHTDAKAIIDNLIVSSGSSGGADYFEKRAKEVCEALIKGLVQLQCGVSLPDLYHFVLLSDSDPEAFRGILSQMMNVSTSPDVCSVAAEMYAKSDPRHEASKEFNYIMGDIKKSLSFMSDPLIRDCVNPSGFSLDALTSPKQPCTVYVCIPAEYVAPAAPLLRLIFTTAMLYKSRKPQSPTVVFLLDEFAQLGKFKAAENAVSYGRGIGIATHIVVQSISQIKSNYGHHALPVFLGSSPTQCFFGVRDGETAEYLSQHLGSQSIQVPDPLRREQGRQAQMQAITGMMSGHMDPFESALLSSYSEQASNAQPKQSRRLMTASEILSMPPDLQLVFSSSLPPILAHRYPYWQRRELAGAYMNNPYHSQASTVEIKGRFGRKQARIMTEPVPAKFTHFPQYQSGLPFRYVEGYRP